MSDSKRIKILHVSDTHGLHHEMPMSRFDGIDIVIHSGDCSNFRDPGMNASEVFDFLEWYQKVPVVHKLYIAGNHDSSIESRIHNKNNFADRGIIYLEHEYYDLLGFRIFGSPYTPTFGDWCFMKKREKMDKLWGGIDGPVDIFVTHGPPRGVRDLSYDRSNKLEMCGDRSLYRHLQRLKPKLVCYGHIHNVKDIVNQGISIQGGIIYSNGACVEDGRFDKGLTSYGNVIEL